MICAEREIENLKCYENQEKYQNEMMQPLSNFLQVVEELATICQILQIILRMTGNR